jgi:hypothetical protein
VFDRLKMELGRFHFGKVYLTVLDSIRPSTDGNSRAVKRLGRGSNRIIRIDKFG